MFVPVIAKEIGNVDRARNSEYCPGDNMFRGAFVLGSACNSRSETSEYLCWDTVIIIRITLVLPAINALGRDK